MSVFAIELLKVAVVLFGFVGCLPCFCLLFEIMLTGNLNAITKKQIAFVALCSGPIAWIGVPAIMAGFYIFEKLGDES